MRTLKNPFITSGYESAEYFCDREQESRNLIREVTNGNNLALISTRRMGKTGLIQHCFHNPEIKDNYYTFFVDIYATKSLRDFVFSLSRVIVDGLKPFGRKAIEGFWNSVKSLQGGITFDPAGNPSFNLQLGDIHATEATLDEIFRYMERAAKPVIVAIDEFQQVASYTERTWKRCCAPMSSIAAMPVSSLPAASAMLWGACSPAHRAHSTKAYR